MHIYALTMKDQKDKLNKHTIASKRIKYLGINLPKETKDLYQKTIRHWLKKLNKMQTDRKIYCALRLEEFILLKWPNNPPRQSTDSMQSLWKYLWPFS